MCLNEHIFKEYFYGMRFLTVLYVLTLMFSILEVEVGGVEQTFHDEYDYYLLNDSLNYQPFSGVDGSNSPLSFGTFPLLRFFASFYPSPKNQTTTREQTQRVSNRLFIMNCTYLI